MANKSYIIEKENGGKVIIDNSYEISIVQKILVSGNPKIVSSTLFKDSFAIEGDFNDGLYKLRKFFDKLSEDSVYDKFDFKNQSNIIYNKIKSFNVNKIILKPSEIFNLDENQNINTLLNDIKTNEVDDYILQIENQFDEYKKKIDTISRYSDYIGIIFKRKNKKKLNLLSDIMENIDYYIKFKIGL